MESKKNPNEMDFWQQTMYDAARYLPGAFCGGCGSQLEPRSISDNIDEVSVYGFNGVQLELVWISYQKCCSIEDPIVIQSWDSMISAFCKSLFGDRYL